MVSRIFISFIAAVLFLSTAYGQSHHIIDQYEIQCREIPSSLRIAAFSAEVPAGQIPANMKVHWYLNPFERFIRGELHYMFHYDSSLPSSLALNLVEDLTIDSLYLNQQNLEYSRDGRLLIIQLPVLQDNVSVDLVVHYSGVPPNNGFGSFVIDNSFDNNPILWTLSEPYYSSDWWPCPASRTMKLDTVDVFTHTPPEFYAAGNGRLESIDSSGTDWIHHWKSRYPIAPYLIATSIMKYHVVKDQVILQGDTLPILDYIFGGSVQEWAEAAPRLEPMLQFYDSLFIHYPFIKEKYGHAQFNWGGGMEHQTMSFMAYPGEALTAHELAHQWFGNYITCGSWSEIWLNEGFATYLTGLYYERIRPAEFLDWKNGQIESVTSQDGGSVIVDDTTSVSRIFDGRLSYSKAAMVLHMLRKYIGDNAFFNGIRSYLNDDALKYAYSNTTQLKLHFEQACNCDLNDFFQTWLYEEGFPIMDVSCIKTENGLVIKLNQKGSINHNSPYKFTQPIRLIGEGLDTLIEVKVESNSHVYTVPTVMDVKVVELDPFNDVLARYKQRSILLQFENEDVLLYPNPSKDELRINIRNAETWPAKVEVYDLTGRRIGEFKVLEGGLIETSLQTSVCKGMYVLSFTLSGKRIQKRFVLE